MALKVKAQEKLQKIGKYEGTYRYIMMPELYTSLSQEKVIKEAALRSGVSKGIMQACWDAAGEVIKAWATEGHSVALPGLGTMRFGIRAKSVAKVDEVKAGLVTSPNHLHPSGGSEGGAGRHSHPDYLLRPRRQGG